MRNRRFSEGLKAYYRMRNRRISEGLVERAAKVLEVQP
jgi:hypothetical protein